MLQTVSRDFTPITAGNAVFTYNGDAEEWLNYHGYFWNRLSGVLGRSLFCSRDGKWAELIPTPDNRAWKVLSVNTIGDREELTTMANLMPHRQPEPASSTSMDRRSFRAVR